MHGIKVMPVVGLCESQLCKLPGGSKGIIPLPPFLKCYQKSISWQCHSLLFENIFEMFAFSVQLSNLFVVGWSLQMRNNQFKYKVWLYLELGDLGEY